MRDGWLADFGRLWHRQPDCQNGAGAVPPVLRFDATALRLDKAATDCQSETGSGAAAILGLDTIKFVKDTLEIIRRNAGPLIHYLERDNIAVTTGTQIDAAPGG